MHNLVLKKNYLSILIIVSFILGFFLNEDVAGGGHLDLPIFYKNFLIIKNNNFFLIPWNEYVSSGLPLHHLLVANIIFFSENIFFLKFFSFILSLFCILIFYKILKLKYEIHEHFNSSVLLISVIPLLSPYFRTSGFWGLEENTCYLFFLISAYFFLNKNCNSYNYLAILFSIFTVLIRQSFVFWPLFLFLYYFNFTKIFSKRNLYIFFSFFIFSLPIFYFIFIFKGFTNEPTRITFTPINVPIILSFFFIYLFPFILIHSDKLIRNLTRRQSIVHLVFFLVFYFLFKNQFEIINFYNSIGGGLIYKFIFNLNIVNINFNIKVFLFLLISYLGFFFLISIVKKNIFILIFFLVSLTVYSFVNVIFQEYFDPLIFFIFIIFNNYIKKKNLNKFSIIIFFFYFLLLMLSFTYRYYIIPRSIIS
jgi:hypothetical protein